MRPLVRPLSRSAATLLALGLIATSCDGTPDGSASVTFRGVPLEATGGTSLALDGDALLVSDVPSGADGGFRINGARTRVDVDVDPITLPSGARFGASVEEADGTPIASMDAEGLVRDQVRLAFSFGSASAVTRVRILYKRDGATVFEIPDLTLTQSFAASRVSEGTAGTGEGKAGSVHAIRQGGRWVVVSDSEGDTERSADAGGGCAGYLLTPPAIAGVPAPPDLPLCVDWVEVQPLDGQAAEGARTVVRARGVESFRVRELTAR